MTVTISVVCELARQRHLPAPALVSVGAGHAVLAMHGWWPLDDLLAWAGEMPAVHWWTLAGPDTHHRRDVYAAGTVHGLAVTLVARTDQALPPAPGADDVIAAATAERAAHTRTRRSPGVGEDTGPLPLIARVASASTASGWAWSAATGWTCG